MPAANDVLGGGGRWAPRAALVLCILPLLLAAGLVGALAAASEGLPTERPARQVVQVPPLQLNSSTVHRLTRVRQRDLAVAVLANNGSVYNVLAAYNAWMARFPKVPMEVLSTTVWTELPPKRKRDVFRIPYMVSKRVVLPRAKHLPVDENSALTGRGAAHALRHLAETYPNAKWYMVTNPRAFVVMPNLLASLENLDEAAAWVVGQAIPEGMQLNGTGHGALLSRPALERLVPRLDSCLNHWAAESADIFMVKCAAADGSIAEARLAGLYAGLATDVNLSLRSYYPEGLVQLPLAFSNVEAKDMYVYSYFLFEAKTRGRGTLDHRMTCTVERR